MPSVFLDCKGLNCPMPIVKVSKAIKAMASGDELTVEADDPAFRVDLEAWAAKLGHAIVTFETDGPQRAVIRKS